MKLAEPDFFIEETKSQRKTRLYAAARRWAQRLPNETGEDHRRTYDRMMQNFLGALRT